MPKNLKARCLETKKEGKKGQNKQGGQGGGSTKKAGKKQGWKERTGWGAPRQGGSTISKGTG